MVLILILLFAFGAVGFEVEQKLDYEQTKQIYSNLSPYTEKVQIGHFEDQRGWGVKAMEDIKAGDRIFQIPSHKALTSFDNYEWAEFMGEQPPMFLLTVRLVYERFYRFDKSDYINQYVHSLPQSVHSFLTWSQVEQKALYDQCAFLINPSLPLDRHQAYFAFMQWLRAHEDVNKQCPECSKSDNFNWAFNTAMARKYTILKSTWATANGEYLLEGEEGVMGEAIFPGWDLINHRPYGKKYRTFKDVSKEATSEYGSYSFFAEYDNPAGTEVTRTYDLLRNYELLYFQGTVLRKNADDFMFIDTDLTGYDSDICQGGEYKKDVDKCRFIIFPDEISQKFILFKRIQLTGDLDLEEVEDLFEYYTMMPLGSETAYTFGFAAQIYRYGLTTLLGLHSKVSFREQSRQQREARNFATWVTYEYSLSEKVSLYRSLRLIDQELLKMLFFDLGPKS